MAVGLPATLVAVVGVVTPMVLGYGVDQLMHGQDSWMAHAFVGAMLAATSVGITARVLQGAKAIRTPSARIILGAAVIDDVLGLVVLAIIAGVIKAAAAGTTLDAMGIAAIVVKAFAFLFGAIADRLLPLPAHLPPRPRHPVDRGRAGPLPEPVLRPRLARHAGRPRRDRGGVRGRPRPRGRALRGPREAGREAAPREPSLDHRPPRPHLLRPDGHAGPRRQLPEAGRDRLRRPSHRGRDDRQVGLRPGRAPRRLPRDRRRSA